MTLPIHFDDIAAAARRLAPVAHRRVGDSREQAVEADLLRADAVQRRQPPHQHEVQAAVARRLLDGQLVGRSLDDAQQRRIAPHSTVRSPAPFT